MKKALLLFLVLAPALSCKKHYFEFKGWAAPPPGFVAVPSEVYKRFYAQKGILYEYANILYNDSSHNGQFAVYSVSNTESYPTDSMQYKEDILNNNAKDIFYTVFFDHRKDTQFFKSYDLIVEQIFKVEQKEVLRKTLKVRYTLNDSFFLK